MDLAAGQPPQQVTIDGAELELAAPGAFARAGDVVEYPGHFSAGKIGIDDQAGLGRNCRLMAFGLQASADVGGAAVLPDDGAVNGLAGDAVPHHRGFALVGDTDGGNVLGRDIRPLQRLAAGRHRRGPDVLRLVFDPARGRKMLREFLLRGRCDGNIGAKDDGARGGGALIDGQHIGHGVASRVSFVVRWRKRQADRARFVNISACRPPLHLARLPERSKPKASGEGDSPRVELVERKPSPHPRPAKGAAREQITPPRSSHRRRSRWSGRS